MTAGSEDGTDFDFAAAELLSSVLSQLSEKVNWLAWVRATQAGKCLDPVGGSWEGARRHQFDHRSASHQAALASLAAEALTARQQVDNAITHAFAARQAGPH
ncbi:hypothetical protein ACFO3J_26665 [Streptomyces polygonati]|uniref:Uncharacterized protein n=1 Tax=Streptomyces polygonati TaxID=1617087 RepID=A0ABV8HYV4_9ACTN